MITHQTRAMQHNETQNTKTQIRYRIPKVLYGLEVCPLKLRPTIVRLYHAQTIYGIIPNTDMNTVKECQGYFRSSCL